MGLDYRKKSGRIANGSRLIVPGQITGGQKVFPTTFRFKQPAPKDIDLLEKILPFLTPQPTSTPSVTVTPTITPTPSPTPTPSVTVTPTITSTPTPTPTPSSTSTENIEDAIITENNEYIQILLDEYLKFVDPF